MTRKMTGLSNSIFRTQKREVGARHEEYIFQSAQLLPTNINPLSPSVAELFLKNQETATNTTDTINHVLQSNILQLGAPIEQRIRRRTRSFHDVGLHLGRVGGVVRRRRRFQLGPQKGMGKHFVEDVQYGQPSLPHECSCCLTPTTSRARRDACIFLRRYR